MIFKKNHLKIVGFLAFLVFVSYTQTSQAQPNQAQALLKEKTLQNVSTTSDSILILLDVYNLSDKVNRNRVRLQLINLAERSDNKEVIFDVLKELSSASDETGSLARLIEISESIQGNHGNDNLRTVLVMEKAKTQPSNSSDSNAKNQEMVEFIRQGMSVNGDPYKEIQNIFRAMVYLGSESQGPLYFEYIKRLEQLVSELPEEDHDIKTLYYTTAALFYTRKRDYRQALENDWKLIQELDKLSAHYSDQEAAHKDLDYFYYVSYRRMLRNFKGLTPEQVEKVYAKCLALAKSDERAAMEFGNGGLTNSYYYMATKQYPKAIPELKKALNNENISDFRKGELLGHLSFAMRNTGDKEGELQALREYSQMLLKDRTKKRDDMYKEIELRNSVNQILLDEYQAQEQQRQENRVMRKTSITLVYVLAIILIFLCGAYLRLRRKVKILEDGNTSLRRNIEHIFDDGVPRGSQNLRLQKNRLKG